MTVEDADDTVIHCKSEAQAKFIMDKAWSRKEAYKLELHPIKTKIVDCQDKDRRKQYGCTQFDFLGYTYQKVLIKDRTGSLQFNFLASVSKNATKSLNASIRAMEMHKQTESKIEMIAEMLAHWVLSKVKC